MRRIPTSFLTIISLLAAILMLFLFWSSRQHEELWGFSTLHGRYTFIAYHGRLWVNASPSAKWTTAEAEAWNEVKRLRNEDIQWTVSEGIEDNVPVELLVEPDIRPGTPAWRLLHLSSASDQPLLRALDGPRKFVAASVILSERHNSMVRAFSIAKLPDLSRCYDSPVVLAHPAHRDEAGRLERPTLEKGLIVNTAYLPTLRDEWHSKLDRKLFTFRIWWIFASTVTLPLARTGWALRKRLARREGLCSKCGYDLRASTGVCPECGAPTPKNASTPSAV
ncbi:MAG TPA: hypothetical protein VFW23_11485 [Tepidisphaeraceae bacterium]|nr:hypothetical protein [Tepidisphaeraceae bacterium]